MNINPDDLLQLRQFGVSSMGQWDLQRFKKHHLLLTNRKEVQDVSKIIDGGGVQIKYIIMRTELKDYYILKHTLGDFITSNLQKSITPEFVNTMLPIMIAKEGVYIVYLNPEFYIYSKLLQQECVNNLKNVIKTTFHTSNTEWISIELKKKIKDLYDYYPNGEERVYGDRRIRDELLYGWRSYIEKLTLPKEYPTYCEGKELNLFFTEVLTWDMIEHYSMTKEYINFELRTISKDCPPSMITSTNAVNKLKFKSTSLASFLPYKQTVHYPSSEKEREMAFLRDTSMSPIFGVDITITQSDLIDKKKRRMEPEPGRRVKRKFDVEEELYKTLKMLKVDIKETLEQMEDDEINTQILKVEEIANQTMHTPPEQDIEQEALRLQKEFYVNQIKEEVEEYLSQEFKYELDGTIEVNSYHINDLYNITNEEVMERISFSDIVNNDWLTFEEILNIVEETKLRFIYRTEIKAMLKSIIKHMTYTGFNLTNSIRKVETLSDGLIFSKLENLDYNYVTREEIDQLIILAKIEYIDYLRQEMSVLHTQLDKNHIFRIFQLMGLSRETSEQEIYEALDLSTVDERVQISVRKYVDEYLNEGQSREQDTDEKYPEIDFLEDINSVDPIEKLQTQIVEILNHFRDSGIEKVDPEDKDLIEDIKMMIDPTHTRGMTELEVVDEIMRMIDIYEGL